MSVVDELEQPPVRVLYSQCFVQSVKPVVSKTRNCVTGNDVTA